MQLSLSNQRADRVWMTAYPNAILTGVPCSDNANGESAQRAPINVFHDEVVGPHVVERTVMRVIQGCDGLSLALMTHFDRVPPFRLRLTIT